MNLAKPLSSVQAGMVGRWLWFLGAAALVFSFRLREIHLHSGPTPILDQWDAEARQILVPWLEGQLSWRAFFAPHNEHIPVWTRLFSWLQAAVLGRWDPQLQATFNAGLHAIFAGTVAIWLQRRLPRWPAFALTALIVVLASLPFSWENSTWGFQAHTPLALLLVFVHVRGSFERAPGSAAWWLAQLAGGAALFTYGSMWAAPAAVTLTSLWSAAPERRRWIFPALLAAAGLALVWFARARQDPAHTQALASHSPREFLAAFLVQLGWPTWWAGAGVVLWLPAFFLALQIRRRRRAENFDRIIVALAVWAVAQAGAFAFARGGGYIGFVSRYGDLLALGVLANGLALWRLGQASVAKHRWLVTGLALAWFATLVPGLIRISTRGHTEFYHSHIEAWTNTRREAVRQYLATRDVKALSTPDARAVLYPNPEVVARALDTPGLPDLLPAVLRPGSAPAHGDGITAAAASLRAHWSVVAIIGSLALLLTFALPGSTVWTHAPALELKDDTWLVPILGVIAAGSALLVFLWPHPLRFGAERRWQALLNPPGTVPNLSFHITTDTSYPKDNLVGGADLWPVEMRNLFFGTELDGPKFKGIAESSPFTIHSPWLVIPFAGFPASVGNGLRLKVWDPNGTLLEEIGYPGPNPREIDFWAVDVHAYPGCTARVIFYDARDDAEGWVAAAPPQAAETAEVAAARRRDRELEPTQSGHDSLGLIALASALLAIGTVVSQYRRRPAW